MKKNTLLAIVLLVAVVVGFAFLPLSSAKKPQAPATVTLDGALRTVGTVCGGVDKDTSPTAVAMVRTQRDQFVSTDSVAIWIDLAVTTHPRDHGSDFEIPAGGACKEASLTVTFQIVRGKVQTTTLTSALFGGVDIEDPIEGRVAHEDRFIFSLFDGPDVDESFSCKVQHIDSHSRQGGKLDHFEIANSSPDPCEITGTAALS